MTLKENLEVKLKTLFIFDKEKRRALRKELYEKFKNNKKLIMTLLVKDEVDIIRENILYHKEMGIDGIIVTDNNSTDGTLEILEELQKEGIILEIIKEPTLEYFQKEWVDRMIKLAINKYKADIIINIDADEFWYTSSLNLKETILKNFEDGYNVLNCVLKDFVPIEEKDDFLSSTYFKGRNLVKYELDELDINKSSYSWENNVTKVIHKAKGYKQISQGNHFVKMKKHKGKFCPEITIYHYAIRNYKHFEAKTIKGGKSHEKFPNKALGSHWRAWYEFYKEGKLKDVYERYFRKSKKNDLLKYGAIHQDSAIINFLKYKKIK